jgi:hypothetical protein
MPVAGVASPHFEPSLCPNRMFSDQTRFCSRWQRTCSPREIPNSIRNQRAAHTRNGRDPRRFCASAGFIFGEFVVSFTSTHFRTLTQSNRFCGAPDTTRTCDLCLRRATVNHAAFARPSSSFSISLAVFFAAVVASLTVIESDIGCRGSRSSTGEVP